MRKYSQNKTNNAEKKKEKKKCPLGKEQGIQGDT
jgi:hypothetical protein